MASIVLAGPLCGQESELKDESGKTIVQYVVEAPEGLAPADAADPAKQVGLFLCFQEHGHPTGDDIFPVQNYAEAGKWWVKAAEGGNLHAASHAALLDRNCEGMPGNREIADNRAKYTAEHANASSR
jgi:hypothetical protein